MTAINAGNQRTHADEGRAFVDRGPLSEPGGETCPWHAPTTSGEGQAGGCGAEPAQQIERAASLFDRWYRR